MKFTVYFTDKRNEPDFGKSEYEPNFIAYQIEETNAHAAIRKAEEKLRNSEILDKNCFYLCRVDLDEF